MEEMDIEQVVDIPDTPDRLTARHINGAKSGKESNSSAPGPSRTDFRDKECLNQPRARSSENGHLNPQRISVKMDGFVPRNKSITFTPSENSSRSKNAPLFRRGAMAYNSKPETRLSIGTQHVDKGKPESTKIPLRSRVHMEEEAIFDMAFPCRGSKTLQAEETRDVQVPSSGGSNLRFAPMTSSNSCKGKEKIGVNACNGSGLTLNDGKGIGPTGGSQPKIEKQLSASALPVISPRVTGQKRLVRNGCISPHNIATTAKKLAESHRVGSTNVEKDHVISMVSDGPSEVDIREIVAEENNCHRAKGKGVGFHPSTSTEHNVKIGHASTSCETNNKAANETSDVSRDSLLRGWRSTLNRTKNIYQMEGEDECFIDEQRRDRVVRRNNGNGNVTKITSDSGDHGEGQTASRPVSGLNQTSQSHHIGNVHSKRQRKHRLTSRNQSDSTTVPDDSEIFFLGSSEESSSSRSSRTLNRQHQGMLEPSYEIDELLPERRNNSSPGLGSMNDDSDSRARQVEADEMLARELQEQLYHEAPVYGGSEIDENIAWVLQQEEDAFRTASSQNRPRLRLRNSATVNANRQPQPQSFQNPSNRRRAQTQVPTGRTSLRNRLLNRSTAALPRARNHSHTALSRASSLQFPLGMDLDMRLDILEALEDAVGEFSDMSMTASRILHVQRDFNENDYEMLLALDENNHQPGASVNRINNLPESVVQTENFEETCAICLETPTIGETIRHLPCLHKFHKDCIDPWLGRKTSCPVCKSSIT